MYSYNCVVLFNIALLCTGSTMQELTQAIYIRFSAFLESIYHVVISSQQDICSLKLWIAVAETQNFVLLSFWAHPVTCWQIQQKQSMDTSSFQWMLCCTQESLGLLYIGNLYGCLVEQWNIQSSSKAQDVTSIFPMVQLFSSPLIQMKCSDQKGMHLMDFLEHCNSLVIVIHLTPLCIVMLGACRSNQKVFLPHCFPSLPSYFLNIKNSRIVPYNNNLRVY